MHKQQNKISISTKGSAYATASHQGPTKSNENSSTSPYKKSKRVVQKMPSQKSAEGLENLYKCYARTSSQQLKVRFVEIQSRVLSLMHQRKSTSDGSMQVTISENLLKAHIIRRSPASYSELVTP